MISFIDDNRILLRAVADKDYAGLSNRLKGMSDEFDYSIQREGRFMAYRIASNKPLTSLYGFPVHVVRFFFADIQSLHDELQEEMIIHLLTQLSKQMETTKGYYNLRLPTHVVDLIVAFNKVFPSHVFCGGTVEEYIEGKSVAMPDVEGVEIFRADSQSMVELKKSLNAIASASFASYQGQYHISPVTKPMAGRIYENWIGSALEASPSDVCVVTYKGDVAGFALTESDSDNRALDMLLTCIDERLRGRHIYKSLIAHLINEAHEAGCAFVSSTQFDNYGSQHTWGSLGMTPFYSIYNMHIDLR